MRELSRRGFIKSSIALSMLPLGSYAKEEIITPKDTLKLIHITDSHMDLADDNSVEAIESMVKFVNKNYKDLDCVLFGGDNFNNNASKASDALKFKEIISGLNCPYYVVRGNKESSPHPKGDSINLDEFKKIFVDDKILKVNGKDWLLSIKGYNILGLDSCINNANNGLYEEKTIKFAESTLKDGKPTVILNHHPYTNYWRGTEEKDLHKYILNNSEDVQKRLFSYSNLILTLSGHKHIDSVTAINKTKVIVTRGFVRPLDLDNYPLRYIEITDGDISEKLIYTT
jgi:Icc protein